MTVQCAGVYAAIEGGGADGLSAPAVIGERRIAVGALHDFVAVGAVDEVGIAAAIEEQNRLMLGGECFAQQALEAHADEMDAALLAEFLSQIDHFDDRHRESAHAVGEREQVILRCGVAGLGFVVALERRGGAAEDDGDGFELPAFDGDVAAMIARGGILFVAGVVLFIDDDDSQARKRGEDGGACADDDVSFAGGDLLPVAMTVGLAESAVEDGDAGESGLESFYGLRGQCDFGDEDQCLFPGVDDFANELEIDFGFAASGYAVEEGDGEAAVHAGEEGVEDFLLVFIELEVDFVGFSEGHVSGEAGEIRLVSDGDDAERGKLADGGRRCAGFAAEADEFDGFVVGEIENAGEDGAALGGFGFFKDGLGIGARHFQSHDFEVAKPVFFLDGRGDDGLDHHSKRRHVIAADPAGEFQHF